VTQRVLTQTLRRLERNGMIEHSEEIQNCRRAYDSSLRSLATDTAPARVSTPNLP